MYYTCKKKIYVVFSSLAKLWSHIWFYVQYMEMETAYLSVHVSVNFALVVFFFKQQSFAILMAENVTGWKDTEIVIRGYDIYKFWH